MNLAAIIAEYNPFHNGHLYQIEETRRQGATHIVAVMSGNIVQRSEVACFSKWTRAAAAVRCGVDLVLELPVIYTCSSAEGFAEAAVKTLGGLGIAGQLSFGSECGNLEDLYEGAAALRQVNGSAQLKEFLDRGYSFPNARTRAVVALFGSEMGRLLEQPNNILAIEYLNALEKTGIPLAPLTIPRIGAMHDSPTPAAHLASASLLREIAQSSGVRQIVSYVPANAYPLYRHDFATKQGGASMYDLTNVILYHLRTLTLADLAALPDVSEGLEYRIFTAIQQAATLDELLMRVKCKRYPLSRIKRILLCAMLGITREVAALEPGYLRVLAFNERGREILRMAKKTAAMPVYHSFAKLEKDFPVHASKEALASDLFRWALPKSQSGVSEYRDQRPSFISVIQSPELLDLGGLDE